MKKNPFIFIVLCSLFFLNANAKEVLGLNLCGKVSASEIKKNIENNEGSVASETKDDEIEKTSIEAINYKIGDDNFKVSFSIYKGKLYEIFFEDGGKISGIVAAKYRLIDRKILIDNGYSIQEKYLYVSKDADVEISESFMKTKSYLPFFASSHSLTFMCKSIYKSFSSNAEIIEKKKQILKKGVDKI